MTTTQSAAFAQKMSDEDITEALKGIAEGFRGSAGRTPILKTPGDVGLDYEDRTFPAEDGTPLEAWFVPKAGSQKLVIANHPRGFNRYGSPSHLEPWKSMYAASGNDVEVDFTKDIRVLHDAGYNVLTYDLRNHGHSGAAHGGIGSSGNFESRDVIGSLDHVKNDPALSKMTVGLFSRCLGCNSTIIAMARRPERFEDVRCMVGVQPLSPKFFLKKQLSFMNIPEDRIDELDDYIRLITSFTMDRLSPVWAAKHVRIPSFICQVRDDLMTMPDDVQNIFNTIGSVEKELFWIEGTTRRWDGYNYFSKNPEKMLGWFSRFMD
jgi:hypothetical protein